MKIAFLLMLLCSWSLAIEHLLKQEHTIESLIQLSNGHPDVNLSFKAMCRNKGYPFKSYKILTDDGYWLTVFRIPGGKGETFEKATSEARPVIYLQHGLIDSADMFICNEEDKAAAFILANLGYDVWLGNNRGNKYSRDHQWLDPDDPIDKHEFFNYTFDDMSRYDVVSTIEYIRKITGKEKLGVISHSQGTTQMFVRMIEENEWWNERIAIFVSLAGVAKLENVRSQLLRFCSFNTFPIETLKRLNIVEMFASNWFEDQFLGTVCTAVPDLCNLFVRFISDADTSVNNRQRVGVYLSHYPAGSSLKSFEHFAQLITSKKFQDFDYGEEGNMIEYGQKTPPEYDLSTIKGTKIVQIVGTVDELADLEDNQWLHEQLGENVVFYKEYKLGHLSFAIAKDTTFFDDVVDQLQKYKWD